MDGPASLKEAYCVNTGDSRLCKLEKNKNVEKMLWSETR